MANESCFDNIDCRRAAQYLVTMIAVLLVGFFISILPVMTRLEFTGGLMATDLFLFVSRLAALVFFFLFARHATAAIPEQGGIRSFLRAVVEPIAILVIIVIGQGLFWQIIEPFVENSGKTIYFGTVITLIAAASIWLVYRAYQQSLYLVDAVQYLTAHFPKRASRQSQCPVCGGMSHKDAKFCCHCGHKIEEAINCQNCGKLMTPGQKYCPQCGKAMTAAIPADSER